MNRIGCCFVGVLIALMLASRQAIASNVEWSRMTSTDAEVWDTGPLWMIWGYSQIKPELFGFNSPSLFVTVDGLDLCASQYMGGSCNIWVRQMSAGEEVNSFTMNSVGLDYFYHGTLDSSEVESDYRIVINDSEPIYLGFSTDSGTADNYKVYGWVELSVTSEGPVVKSSAWDVDGGAMYVGGGAVPEPTGALLVLLGGAALLLRRRRRF